jgi:type IV pilus assembly protein PilC
MPAPQKTVAPVKLQTFNYECTNAQGKRIKGEIVSTNLAMAKADLRRQGLIPLKIKKKSYSLFAKREGKKIKPCDIAYLTRQLATMLTAGVPLVQSLDIVAKSADNPAIRNLVLSIKGDVEAGRSFSESLVQHPRYFDPLFCNLVAAGESSGALETMLDRIASYKEKTESLKRKIKKALFYPTAVMVVAIIVTTVLLVFVVPQFEKLFKGFGADLPLFTKMIISASQIMQKWWWVVFGLIGGAILGLAEMKRRYISVRTILDKMTLRLPIIGSILQKAAIARFARTLSTTFAAGVPLVEALESVSGATGNIIFTNAVLQIRDEVTKGSQIQAAMKNTTVFPNMVVQMVAIGEEAGALDKMLSKVASIYEEEVDMAVDSLSSLLEPIIMAILGVIVGGLVIAMYLPIFKMGSVV